MKNAIVTGANTGLGYETALQLAEKGYHVILGCRNEEKARTAMHRIQQEVPAAKLEFIALDLVDRQGIKNFVQSFSQKYDHLDLLVNNAGVMCPAYTITPNNLELQFDANHMGHFYLTFLLLEKLDQNFETRIVNVSSLAGKHERADIFFDNINFKGNYEEGPRFLGLTGVVAYAQSKLANLLFTMELKDRLNKAGKNIKAAAAHPGISATDLVRDAAPSTRRILWIFKLFRPLMGISKARDGAGPSLYAALNPSIQSGDFVGPSGKGERNGKPGLVDWPSRAKDKELCRKLWEFSEKELGISFLN